MWDRAIQEGFLVELALEWGRQRYYRGGSEFAMCEQPPEGMNRRWQGHRRERAEEPSTLLWSPGT